MHWSPRLRRALTTPAALRAAWNFGWMVAGAVISQACLVAVILLATWALGPRQFGSFCFILTIQNYLILVGAAGLPAILVREVVTRPAEADGIVGTYLAITWSVGGLVGAAVLVAGPLLPILPVERLALVVMVLATIPACAQVHVLFDADHRQALAAGVMAVSDLALLAAVLGLWKYGRLQLVSLASCFAVKWVLSTLVLLVIYHRWLRPLRWQISGLEARRFWRSGWPVLAASILGTIPTSGGVIVVRALHGPEEAAIAGLGTQLPPPTDREREPKRRDTQP